jgi:hypothetical protein
VMRCSLVGVSLRRRSKPTTCAAFRRHCGGVGLGVVIGHNVWSGGALPVVVTIVGWVSLIKGVVLLAFPSGQMAKLYEAIRYERVYLAYVGVTLALRIYLTISAFSV